MTLKRRLAEITSRAARAHWPRRRLELWTDEELDAALEHLDPGAPERIKQLTDDELDDRLRDAGLL